MEDVNLGLCGISWFVNTGTFKPQEGVKPRWQTWYAVIPTYLRLTRVAYLESWYGTLLSVSSRYLLNLKLRHLTIC